MSQQSQLLGQFRLHTSAAGIGREVAIDVPDEPSPPKKQKIVIQRRKLEELLKKVRETDMYGYIKAGVQLLCYNSQFMFTPLRFKNCNASTGYGVSFSSAFCETEFSVENKCFAFPSIFTRGMWFLCDCLNDSKHLDAVHVTDEMKICLMKLLTFLLDKVSMAFVRDLDQITKSMLNNETRLIMAIAEHLLGKLALRKEYTIDQRCKRTDEDCQCRCGCKMDVNCRFGNTSVGEESVWHGDLDILFGCNGEELPVLVTGEEQVSLGGSSVEVRLRSLKDYGVKQQLIAETIVFSFLQRKRQPDLRHFFIPSVGISREQVMFYFYDSEEDILLQSEKMQLQQFSGEACIPSIIAIWLVINYKHLGCGLTGELVNLTKSDFFRLAGTMLPVYRDHLSLGNVNTCIGPDEPSFCKFELSKFVWPEGVERPEGHLP